MKIVSVEEMRRIEAEADAAGHSYAAMMEQAGRGVAAALLARREVRNSDILVLVGPGNNGGDGLVAARYLAEAGARVACYLFKPRDPAADENLRLAQERGVAILLAAEDAGREKLRRAVSTADVVIDALLGTGVRLPLTGPLAELLRVAGEEIAARRAAPANRAPFVLAVDGPSGLDYDAGALDAAAIPADLTVTFAHPKRGHFRFPGAAALGELLIADIGTPPALAARVTLELVTPEAVRRWLPRRPLDAHKGTFGKAMIVAGSIYYTGAAYLAASAAIRAGVGLVTLAPPAAIHLAVAARLAEATYFPLPDEGGLIAAAAAPLLLERARDYDALLIGPGLGHTAGTTAFLAATLEQSAALPPLIVDADGLNILAGMEDWARRLPPLSVLTPHPGEMARLIGCSVKEVQADRVETAQRYAAMWGHVVVLKGAYTVVAAPDGRAVIEPFANPGLATAGAGDVLAGAIVALRAQGLGAFEAAVAGAYLHGLAGELARAEGTAGMAAGDVLACLRQAWRNIAA